LSSCETWLFITDNFDDEMRRLHGGPFIKGVVSHYDAVINTKNGHTDRKVLMYSGHDTTISYVLNTLDLFNGLVPPYVSLVMSELLYMHGWKVRISYRNDTSSHPMQGPAIDAFSD
jgi:hypothetical protein